MQSLEPQKLKRPGVFRRVSSNTARMSGYKKFRSQGRGTKWLNPVPCFMPRPKLGRIFKEAFMKATVLQGLDDFYTSLGEVGPEVLNPQAQAVTS